MKVLIQNLKSGSVDLLEAPTPTVGANQILLQNSLSLVSIGTEKMLLKFGKANVLQKMAQQPEKVKEVINKLKTDGIVDTYSAVQSKLDSGIVLGYSSVGTAVQVGSGVTGIKVGDRVASNAPHSDFAVVNKNLCAKVAATVSDEDAVFTVIASIALQSIRLTNPQLAETVAVIGVGLVGLLIVELLLANGCRVLAIDFDKNRLQQAKDLGAEICELPQDPITAAAVLTNGIGVDAVIVSASTDSSDPMLQAASMCRVRGKIILVGVAGLNLERETLYRKEISVQVSCSYGPGRYDFDYEVAGNDYPVGYVRWTEQRNFAAVLQLLASKKLQPSKYIDHKFDFDNASAAYQLLDSEQSVLGIVLKYPSGSATQTLPSTVKALTSLNPVKTTNGKLKFEVIGAGNYCKRKILPELNKNNEVQLVNICSAKGVSATQLGKKFGFSSSSTKPIFADSNANNIDAVVIASQHDSHCQYILEAMAHDKNIFVEKPLAITLEQVAAIAAAAKDYKGILTVGFNRRFSPLIVKAKQLLNANNKPLAITMTINAGVVPADNWQHNLQLGGGRIVGEACHFVDLMVHLLDSEIVDYKATFSPKQNLAISDIATISLAFANGSIGTINYFANGHKSYAKEKITIFGDDKVLELDNFKTLKGYGFKNFNKLSLWQQDKGQKQLFQAFIAGCKQGQYPISFDELIQVSKVCIDLR